MRATIASPKRQRFAKYGGLRYKWGNYPDDLSNRIVVRRSASVERMTTRIMAARKKARKKAGGKKKATRKKGAKKATRKRRRRKAKKAA